MLRAGPGGADADGSTDGEGSIEGTAEGTAAAAAPLEAAARLAAGSGAAARGGMLWSSAPARFTPRQAYYMPRRVLPAAAAVGRASADLVCPLALILNPSSNSRAHPHLHPRPHLHSRPCLETRAPTLT